MHGPDVTKGEPVRDLSARRSHRLPAPGARAPHGMATALLPNPQHSGHRVAAPPGLGPGAGSLSASTADSHP